MRRIMLLLAVSLWAAGCAAPAKPSSTAASGAMRAFASDKELVAFARRVAARQRATPPQPVQMYEMSMPAPPVVSPPAPTVSQDVAAIALKPPGITDTQEADVDEGGIVKSDRARSGVAVEGQRYNGTIATRSSANLSLG